MGPRPLYLQQPLQQSSAQEYARPTLQVGGGGVVVVVPVVTGGDSVVTGDVATTVVELVVVVTGGVGEGAIGPPLPLTHVAVAQLSPLTVPIMPPPMDASAILTDLAISKRHRAEFPDSFGPPM